MARTEGKDLVYEEGSSEVGTLGRRCGRPRGLPDGPVGYMVRHYRPLRPSPSHALAGAFDVGFLAGILEAVAGSDLKRASIRFYQSYIGMESGAVMTRLDRMWTSVRR